MSENSTAESVPEPSGLTACPYCGEQIQRAATQCRYCRNDLGHAATATATAAVDGKASGKRRLPLLLGGAALLLALLAAGAFFLTQGDDDGGTEALDRANREALPPEVVEDIFAKQVRENVTGMRELPKENLVSLGRAVCKTLPNLGKDLAVQAIYNNSDASEAGAENFVTISVVAFCPEYESEL